MSFIICVFKWEQNWQWALRLYEVRWLSGWESWGVLHGVDKSFDQNLEDRMGVLGMFTPVRWRTPSSNKQTIQPTSTYDLWRKKKKKVEVGFRNKKKKQTNNCFLQYFFYSCFFFLLLFYFFKTLKLESSVAPHTASFFRLAELYTLWNPAWMIQKIIIIATMRIYCMRGENFTWSFLLWSLGFLSF